MLNLLRKNSFFLTPLIILLIALIPLFLLASKINIHIFLNQHYSQFADFIFKNSTVLGSGLSFVIVGVVFLLFSIRRSFVITSSGLLAGILVQVLKRLVFPGMLRPSTLLSGIADLHIVEGVNLHSVFSFPSGHSATIFALCFCLAAFTKRKLWKFVLFCLAALVAYSRVYLSQHFLFDVYVGAIIGVLSGIIMTVIFTKMKIIWFDKSLINLLN